MVTFFDLVLCKHNCRSLAKASVCSQRNPNSKISTDLHDRR